MQVKDRGHDQDACIPHNPFLHNRYPFPRFGLIWFEIPHPTGSFVSSTVGSCRNYKQAKTDLRRGPEGLEAYKPPCLHPSPYVTLYHLCKPPLHSFSCPCIVTHKNPIFHATNKILMTIQISNFFSLTILDILHLRFLVSQDPHQ